MVVSVGTRYADYSIFLGMLPVFHITSASEQALRRLYSYHEPINSKYISIVAMLLFMVNKEF